MKQAVQPDASHTQRTAESTRSRPAQKQIAAPGGHLAQLAAMMNSSPRVQVVAQMQLVTQQNNSTQSLIGLAAEINQSASMEVPVQLEGPASSPSRHTDPPSRRYESQMHNADLSDPMMPFVGQRVLDKGVATSDRPHAGEVIQRVILLDSSELEWSFIVGARSMKKLYPGESINLLQRVDLSTLPEGENIRLIAHGHEAEGLFANKPADKLAGELKARGLKLSAGAINLMSCNSGANGPASYVAELAKQFNEVYEVTGYQGIAAINLSGKTDSFNPLPEHVERYQAIQKKYDQQVQAANKIAQEAGAKMNAKGADVEAIVLQTSLDIEALTGSLTAELVALNNEILRQHEAGLYVHKAKKIHFDRLPAKAREFLEKIEIEQKLRKELKEVNVRLQADRRTAAAELDASKGSDAAWRKLNDLNAHEASNDRMIESSELMESEYEFEFYRITKFLSTDVVR